MAIVTIKNGVYIEGGDKGIRWPYLAPYGCTL